MTRFIRLPWPKGKQQGPFHSADGNIAFWQGETTCYQRLALPARYRRALLCIDEESWFVLDRLESQGEHDYRLHWLFADVPYKWNDLERQLELAIDAQPYFVQWGAASNSPESVGELKCSLIRGEEGSARGWRARNYRQREPALSLAIQGKERNILFWTLLGPHQADIQQDANQIQITLPKGKTIIKLAGPDFPFLVDSISGPNDGYLNMSS